MAVVISGTPPLVEREFSCNVYVIVVLVGLPVLRSCPVKVLSVRIRQPSADREPSYRSRRNWKLRGALSCCTDVR
ncbi:hypothetical protein DPMN_096169 [Dreissena polymorpha]|uniref:Uncharacterized protein n=1 Tax=Dreissena polymorpha TaxID=45954 RepID=A0A9D4R4H7_DREPO|nr:hypothetical protein DPMN_096169 [Dreissena polymorpha]